MKEKHPVQFGKTLWEQIGKATNKYNSKHNTHLTLAQYVRTVVSRHLKRAGQE